MSSAGSKNSKPPSASESFASFKAAKKTYCSIDYQIECLNELYNQLMPQTNGNRRAGSSSRTQDGSQNTKVLQQLRELKANLRKDYGNPRDIPPLERLKVVVMFDDEKKAFFDIRLRPFSGYPTGYPFFVDDNDKGTIVGISEAIYQEVLKAVQEEEEEEGGGGNLEGNNSSLNHNNNISHAAEEGLIRVNIKQEVGDDVEVVEVITLKDDSDKKRFDNEQHQENYNSQVVPPSTDNNAMSADFRGSASSAAAAAASVAAIPSENGPAVNPQDNIDINSSSNDNAVQQQQRQQSVNGGSTVSRGQSERQSEEVPIKLEPIDSFTVTVTRVGRSPNRTPRKAPDEAPAPAASSEVVPPAPPANVRVLQVNLRPPNVFPSKSKPQQQQLPPSHNNNETTTSAQQRQQQLPATAAAAAVAEERGTLKMKPTENSSTYRILDSNNNKRPAANCNSNAAQPQGSPKRAKVSASPGASTQAKTASQAVAEHFLASAAFLEAAEAQKLDCPLCERRYARAEMSDHLDMWHINRGRYVSYRCTAQGCTYTNIWGVNARAHALREHGCEQYIVKAAVPRTGASLASSSSSSSAAAAKHLATTTTTASTTSTPSATTSTPSATTTTAATTSTPSATTSTPSATTTTATTAATTSTPSATTSTPSAASALQQQQHQQPSTTSASTSASTAQRLSAEDYLRAHCPDYVAAKNGRTRVRCSDCSKVMDKYLLKEHFVAVHRGLKPFHCQWPGCSYTTGFRWKALKHVRDVHKDRSYAQYIVYREE